MRNCSEATHFRYDTGRCDREVNCGYHKTPHEHFEETNSQPEKSYRFPKKELRKPLRPSGFSTINHTLVEESMNKMAFNNFDIWLREHSNTKDAMEATLKYKVGGHNLWPNATVFWQIDQRQRVRAGKIMLYDHHTGHKAKNSDS